LVGVFLLSLLTADASNFAVEGALYSGAAELAAEDDGDFLVPIQDLEPIGDAIEPIPNLESVGAVAAVARCAAPGAAPSSQISGNSVMRSSSRVENFIESRGQSSVDSHRLKSIGEVYGAPLSLIRREVQKEQVSP
jgi:hypothetical protein